jgi:hypothetical protein
VSYGWFGVGLGDTWATVNALLHESVRTGTSVAVAPESPDHRALIEKILALLDSPGSLQLTPWPPTQEVPWAPRWTDSAPYFPTKQRWRGDKPWVAVQFDGRSSSWLKNPPPADLERLQSWAPGYEFKPVGAPLTLDETVDTLIHARLFLGSCSGCSHVAHSVGIPTVIIEYDMPITPWHGRNRYQLARGTDHAILLGRKALMPRIYRAHHSHFGDIFVTIQLLASGHYGDPVLLSRWQNGTEDLGPLMHAILDVLDIPAGRVVIVDERPTDGFEASLAWRVPFMPTKRRWRPGPHKRIAVQFDGRSVAELKNPPPDQLAELMGDWLPAGYTMTTIGLPRTVQEDVDILATSNAFIGCDSGMSHLCHSVGTPCFLLEYRMPLELTHSGKAYTRCGSAAEAIARVRTLLGQPTALPASAAPPPPKPAPLPQNEVTGVGAQKDLERIAWTKPRLRKTRA